MVTRDKLLPYSIVELREQIRRGKYDASDIPTVLEFIDEQKKKNKAFVEKLFESDVYHSAHNWLRDNGIAREVRFSSKVIDFEYTLSELFAAMSVFAGQKRVNDDKKLSRKSTKKIQRDFGIKPSLRSKPSEEDDVV